MDGNLQLLVLLYELYEFDSPNLLQSFGHIHCVFLVFLITEDKQHREPMATETIGYAKLNQSIFIREGFTP